MLPKSGYFSRKWFCNLKLESYINKTTQYLGNQNFTTGLYKHRHINKIVLQKQKYPNKAVLYT